MPVQQFRCEDSIIPVGDATGENAVECGSIALACADCGDNAGCYEHAQFCPICGEAICSGCAAEHPCAAKRYPESERPLAKPERSVS